MRSCARMSQVWHNLFYLERQIHSPPWFCAARIHLWHLWISIPSSKWPSRTRSRQSNAESHVVHGCLLHSSQCLRGRFVIGFSSIVARVSSRLVASRLDSSRRVSSRLVPFRAVSCRLVLSRPELALDLSRLVSPPANHSDIVCMLHQTCLEEIDLETTLQQMQL